MLYLICPKTLPIIKQVQCIIILHYYNPPPTHTTLVLIMWVHSYHKIPTSLQMASFTSMFKVKTLKPRSIWVLLKIVSIFINFNIFWLDFSWFDWFFVSSNYVIIFGQFLQNENCHTFSLFYWKDFDQYVFFWQLL